ncbi:MAG: cytochrome c biogenesis protein CcdA [Anaeromyxobacter sp.]|nr:cytochrome c biogenesis protein CcdA [Anaeromyxobacter sp.]MBL0276849.1 cytochrome c biogenesis protein CcdA [Anaeromyxobacter sp.]
MELGLSTLALTFGAGLASVASPCVLPVVPLIVTGTAEEHRSRPALVVVGIALSFVAMGVLTSLFGAVIGPALPALEKVVGVLVLVFGLLLLADVNLFKRLGWLQRLQPSVGGRWSGLVMGLSLGLVWIPCVGPMLSSVLATVAAEGTLSAGVLLLLVYSAGFAVPMLLVGYGSQALRRRIRAISGRPLVVRWASGLLLVAFGLVILDKGMLFAGM